jgi:hypothetical protein
LYERDFTCVADAHDVLKKMYQAVKGNGYKWINSDYQRLCLFDVTEYANEKVSGKYD